MQAPNERPKGKIITFYSFKGGTGRSMALANIAWILASAGKRVIAIDWDLEAPGLYRYFRPFLLDPDLINSDGLIDFVTEYSTEAMKCLEPILGETPLPTGRSFQELEPEEQMRIAEQQTPEPAQHLKLPAPSNDLRLPDEWVRSRADLLYYKASLDWRFPSGGVLDFVPAGRQTPSYPTRVNSFDWNQFYSKYRGGHLLDEVAERLRLQYDYVLIDSRTGVSDTSGICTIQMPDVLVVCFTLNNQSIDGAFRITESVVRQRRSLAEESPGTEERSMRRREPVTVWPVPMRVDLGEREKVNRRRTYARNKFDGFLDQLHPQLRGEYWGDVEVLYIPSYAFDELLAPFADLPETKNTVLAACERISSRITSGEVGRLMNPPSPEAREKVLLAFQSTEAGQTRIRFEDDPLQRAEAAFQRLSPKQQEEAYRILGALVFVLGPGRCTSREMNEQELRPDPQVANALIDAGVIRRWITAESGGTETKYDFADAEYLVKWSRLTSWIESRVEPLMARQNVIAMAQEWVASGRKREYLLTGEQLAKADHVRSYFADSPVALQLLKASKARLRFKRLSLAAGVVVCLLVMAVIGRYLMLKNRAAYLLAAANSAPMPLQKVLIAQELDGLPEPAAGSTNLRQIADEQVPLTVLRGDSAPLTGGLFLGPTNMVATSSEDGTIRIWRSDNGQQLMLISLGPAKGDYPSAIDGAPDGKRLAYATHSGGVGVLTGMFGVNTGDIGTEQPPSLQSRVPVRAIAYSIEALDLAAGDDNGNIRFAGPHLKDVLAAKSAINSLAWSPDNLFLIVGSKASLDVFQTKFIGKGVPFERFRSASFLGANSVAVSPDSRQLAAAQTSLGVGIITLWDLATGTQFKHYTMDASATAVAYSPSGLLAGAAGREIRIWNISDDSVEKFSGHTDLARTVRFSADGKLLISALGDGTAFIWQTQTSKAQDRGNLPWAVLISKLKAKTTACLLPAERVRFLGESDSKARDNYGRCETSHGRKELSDAVLKYLQSAQ